MDNSIKLAAYLAKCGIASRRQSESLIKTGKVKVNDRVETNVATRVISGKDLVIYKNEILCPVEQKIVLLLYKPVGVTSTVKHDLDKPTVMKFVPEKYRKFRLFPVGRLDEASEGLIILTNDGDLAYRLTHPKFQVDRTYEVLIIGRLSSQELSRLKSGIPLKDGKTKPAKVEILDEDESNQYLSITISEGRHHQIRRMMAAVNKDVRKLIRVSHGPYELGNLQPGETKISDF